MKMIFYRKSNGDESSTRVTWSELLYWVDIIPVDQIGQVLESSTSNPFSRLEVYSSAMYLESWHEPGSQCLSKIIYLHMFPQFQESPGNWVFCFQEILFLSFSYLILPFLFMVCLFSTIFFFFGTEGHLTPYLRRYQNAEAMASSLRLLHHLNFLGKGIKFCSVKQIIWTLFGYIWQGCRARAGVVEPEFCLFFAGAGSLS